MSYSMALWSDFYKYQFLTLCPPGRQEVAKIWNFASLTREPSYSSFFSTWSLDFKNVIFEKKSLGPFWGRWCQEVIFEVAKAKFWISSIFYKFSFRIFIVLGFEVVWPRRPQRPRRGVREFFQKLHFWNQCIPAKKMSYVQASRSKFSLNLSTEEGWVKTVYNLLLQTLYLL